MINNEEDTKSLKDEEGRKAVSSVEEKDKSKDKVDIEELYAESLDRLKEDEIVKGKVVQITKDHVLVDVGFKSEGQVPLEEFLDDHGKVEVKVGDEVDVYIERSENENGLVVLSKEKADQFILWEEIYYLH